MECPFCGTGSFRSLYGIVSHVRSKHFDEIKKFKDSFRVILDNQDKYDKKEVEKAALASFIFLSHCSKKYRKLGRRVLSCR